MFTIIITDGTESGSIEISSALEIGGGLIEVEFVPTKKDPTPTKGVFSENQIKNIEELSQWITDCKTVEDWSAWIAA